MSPLTQGRELKHIYLIGLGAHVGRSPLTQGRELKRVCAVVQHINDFVAPHAGA